MARKNGLTTGDVARETGLPQQTLISWDRAGVLKAARPGRRSSSRAPRVYDEDAVTAALFARSASQMGFRHDHFKEMLGRIQSGDREALEAGAIVTYRHGPGLMIHVFISQIENADDQRWIDNLRENDLLIEGPTTLWTIREHLLPTAKNLIRMGDRPLVDRLVKEIR
jgi:DNA-binding transcriptional MerR regulator